MAEVLSIKCDNPVCRNLDTPEHVPWLEENRKRRKTDRITGPYGWIELEGWMVGCGPNIQIVVCSVQCVEPAIDDALRRNLEDQS